MHDFEISLDRRFSVGARFFDRLALSGDTRQLRYEHAVTAFGLRHHHDIELAHHIRISFRMFQDFLS